MADPSSYIEQTGQIISELEKFGLAPVLIGGMALVILGSRRVTRDFDFLVSKEARDQEGIIKAFYENGFELASKINQQGEIVSTIDNERGASIRLKLDVPSSAHFLNRQTGLRIDLLFDFPFPADEIALRARKKKIHSYCFRVASRKDLLRLKEVARRKRNLAADVQDVEFLKKLR